MSLDPKGSTRIDRVDLYPTPLWSANISVNTQQERKVSLNEDLLSFIRGEYDKNPNSPKKSNREGGWQSHSNLHKDPAIKDLGQQVFNVCKTIFPDIKGMKFTQMAQTMIYQVRTIYKFLKIQVVLRLETQDMPQ